MTDEVNRYVERIISEAQVWIDRATLQAGTTLDAIGDLPLMAPASKFIGTQWLTLLLGKVDTPPLQKSVEALQQQYPDKSPADIAHHIVQQQAMEAGKVGLLTNLLPPLAIALLGVEVAVMIKLQTEMTYKVAAAYGFDLQKPERKGEALGIFLLSLGAETFKFGTNFLEVLPGIGAAIGATTNAALVYSLGWSACRYYEAKAKTPNLQA